MLYPSLKKLEQDWTNCTRCPLGMHCRNHVLHELLLKEGDTLIQVNKGAEGIDVLIVGEGPGVGEDVVGRPFIGPSGKLLRDTLLKSAASGLRICLTNLVACRPFANSPRSPENRAPATHEIEACHNRLVGLIQLLEPRLLIAAGRVPESPLQWALEESGHQAAYAAVRHPAWVIRQSDQVLARSVYEQNFKEVFDGNFKES